MGWLKFRSPESVGAAPAVETFPGDVQTGSQRQERPSQLSNFCLEAITFLSSYLQTHVPLTTLIIVKIHLEYSSVALTSLSFAVLNTHYFFYGVGLILALLRAT